MPTRSWMTYYETEVQPVNVLCDMALRLSTLTLIVLVSYVRSRLTMKTWWHGVHRATSAFSKRRVTALPPNPFGNESGPQRYLALSVILPRL